MKIQPNYLGAVDKFVWQPSKSGIYSAKSGTNNDEERHMSATIGDHRQYLSIDLMGPLER
ncbi:hypothetical protein HID58_086966 [Brassica napus]|uniref:Uncharacterized protein n=1 Tax=Brassica napus TaxID=3708 RepID=A0ABQ7XUX5_BRANA|nr:hypothetical protein HID58_086966 [Brassica napus]